MVCVLRVRGDKCLSMLTGVRSRVCGDYCCVLVDTKLLYCNDVR